MIWYILLLVLVMLMSNKIFLVDAADGSYGRQWSYNKDSVIGPSNWYKNYSLCGGQKQSPINILTKHVKHHKLLGTLKLNNYNYVSDDVYFTMENRNTDIAFIAKVKQGNVPQEVVFQGTAYRFYQFHFHWGAENYKGSEHMIDWQRFAGEMHMIHYNTKYANVNEAAPHDDGLLVWGHFLKVNSMDQVVNKQLQTLLDNFSKAEFCCNKTLIKSFSLYDLLPKDHGKFYYYSGSLTTPPCYQSVKWIIDASPISVSEDQMKLFRQLKDNAVSPVKELSDNFRPSQGLHTREVQRNFDDTAEIKSGADMKEPCFVVTMTMLLIFMYVHNV